MTHPIPFHPANILLPTHPTTAWPVVACDQYTSQPDYWQTAEQIVGDAPSTLRLTLPEIYLNESETERAARIQAINGAMRDYLNRGVLTTVENAMILTERVLRDGRIRLGLVGAIDLCAYDYAVGTKPLIRATEGTVLSRIPPRVAIRRNAELELPHVMLLMDDPMQSVIAPLYERRSELETLYDLDLMQDSGHVKGYLLDEDGKAHVEAALRALAEQMGEDPMLFAVGDGNHSLATAKACAALRPDDPEAAFALVELVNIHDRSLDFEPIYRVVFGVEPADMLKEAREYFRTSADGYVTLIAGGKETVLPLNGLAADVVQVFIDDYLSRHPEGECDYIHGENVVRELARREDAVGFLFDGMEKRELFPYVMKNGALPRKTFSMGEACDKRFYVEARRIKR